MCDLNEMAKRIREACDKEKKCLAEKNRATKEYLNAVDERKELEAIANRDHSYD